MFNDLTTDAAFLKELGRRLARHRLERNLTQDALAEAAGLAKRTLIRLEKGTAVQTDNLIRVLRVLGFAANLEALVPEPAGSPIALVKLHGRRRKRASSSAGSFASASTGAPWKWKDEK